jgi:hypothetical protein
MTDIVSTVVAQFLNRTTGGHVAVVKTVFETGEDFTTVCEACGRFGPCSAYQTGADADALRHAQSCVKLPPRLWVDMAEQVNR